MKKFNLKKRAASDYVVTDKTIQKNRDDMNLSNEKQGVVEKNINLSLPIKNKDNTVPFNQQLASARKKEKIVAITEASMDKKQIDFKSKDKKQVMDINVKTQEFVDKKTEEYKRAEDASKKDTTFWDKYVGVQMEGNKTKVDKNIPASASQLHNKPERFKGKKIDKMVMASLKDADAMLFHIYATAHKTGRELDENERQQVVDIASGKIRLMAQMMVDPIRRSLEYNADPTIKKERNGSAVVIDEGVAIDRFKSCEEAKTNYPEGEIENEQLV